MYLLDVTKQPGSLPVQQTFFEPGHGAHHGHAQEGDIIWQGHLYEPIQLEAKGFDIRGDGRPFDHLFEDGEQFRVGKLLLEVFVSLSLQGMPTQMPTTIHLPVQTVPMCLPFRHLE